MPALPEIDVLHCDGQGGWSGYSCGGGRPKLPISGTLRPVHGQVTLISLPHACLANGLFKDCCKPRKLNRRILLELSQETWGRSIDRFFADASLAKITHDSVNQCAKQLSGAIVGWTGDGEQLTDAKHLGICVNMDIALAVLSRLVGNIFISSRDPDYSWDTLFETAFECDDDLGLAPAFKHEPWNAYQW